MSADDARFLEREARHHAEEQYQRAEQLQRWVDDLQSGLYINCVYCGHRYGPKETTAATIPEAKTLSMREALRLHIAACPEHPLSRAEARIAALLHEREVVQRRLLEIRGWLEDAADRVFQGEFPHGLVEAALTSTKEALEASR